VFKDDQNKTHAAEMSMHNQPSGYAWSWRNRCLYGFGAGLLAHHKKKVEEYIYELALERN
jgi:hypothetical protein